MLVGQAPGPAHHRCHGEGSGARRGAIRADVRCILGDHAFEDSPWQVWSLAERAVVFPLTSVTIPPHQLPSSRELSRDFRPSDTLARDQTSRIEDEQQLGRDVNECSQHRR